MEFNELFDIKEGKVGIKNKKKEDNSTRQVCIRLGVLVGTISLIFLVLCLLDKHSGALGALYVSVYFSGLWLLYLIIETIIFYILKKNNKGHTNLILLVVIIFVSALVVSNFA